MAETPSQRAFLSYLATRASKDSVYLAWAMAKYADLEHTSVSSVLELLGVRATEQDEFLVSRRPEGTQFIQMLRTIASRFQLDEARLASVLRHVDVLEVLQDTAANRSADEGVLLAARMRDATSALRVAKPSAPTSYDTRPDDSDALAKRPGNPDEPRVDDD